MSTQQSDIEAKAYARTGYLAARAGVKRAAGPIWTPQDGPQALAFNSPADEIFYGGAAGGGKTDLELGVGFTQGYKTIIFRREYAQLRDIIARGKDIAGAKAYNANDHVFRLPGGRVVELGAIQYEDDKINWQGRPHDTYCFDEAPQFTESQFLFVTLWLRTTRKGQRARVILAGNPPTNPNEEWIVRRYAPWLDPTHPKFGHVRPGEPLWFARIDDVDTEVSGPDWSLTRTVKGVTETIKPRSRTFIPARVTDNAYLGAEYVTQLQSAPEPLRSQMLYGDFNLTRADDPWQVIPTKWIEAAMQRGKERPEPPGPLSAIGADISRGGPDKTVLAKRYDNWFAPLKKHPGKDVDDGPKAAALVLEEMDGEKVPVNLDAIGVGTSPLDILRANGIDVNAVNFAEGTDERDKSGKYKLRNLRALAYWRFREALDPENGDDIALPDDSEMKADLCAARWKLETAGITIEKKKDIKTRIGRSPDCADAVVMAHMPALAPVGVFL